MFWDFCVMDIQTDRPRDTPSYRVAQPSTKNCNHLKGGGFKSFSPCKSLTKGFYVDLVFDLVFLLDLNFSRRKFFRPLRAKFWKMTRQSSLILITFVSFSEFRVLECNSFEWFNFFRQLTALFILNLSRIQISEHSLYCKIWISFLECKVGCFTELELSSAFLLAWSLRFFFF